MIQKVLPALQLAVLMFVCLPAFAQTTHFTGPAGSGAFGGRITVLANGNYVVVDSLYDEGAVSNVGAVYLYNGITHTLISTLKGSTADDQVGGVNGIVALPNGNFVVVNPNWDNGTLVDAGAATFVNGVSGLNGTVSISNSLVGGNTWDAVGIGGITVLPNGNYVVKSKNWGPNYEGAVSWCNGTTGLTGAVSSSNSLVGGSANDYAGSDGIFVLQDGNYIVLSSSWSNTSPAATDAGAVTWCNGTTGRTGLISSANSLVGSNAGSNNVGSAGGGGGSVITVLPNGKYVVKSPFWDINATEYNVGAVTLCNADGSTVGPISSSNSLVGSKATDGVGASGVQVLPNGSYVVSSSGWNNGTTTDVGAVTWCDASTGKTGNINSLNSLIGNDGLDQIGLNGVTILANGNYVASSYKWGPGTSTYGAVTLCQSNGSTVGIVNNSNSLVGSTNLDNVSYGSGGIVPLSNGNYVVRSPGWNNLSPVTSSAGAITWCSGTTPLVGLVNSSNSLVGSINDDKLGEDLNNFKSVTALTNGNYVVRHALWDNGGVSNVGAATWCNGLTGRTGNIDATNSLIGGTASDQVGFMGITALTNGNYVVNSIFWDNGSTQNVGASTWCDGSTGRTGMVSTSNSLVGTSTNDFVGGGSIALSNGNYVVSSQSWANGAVTVAGAATWGNGSTGLVGTISSNNSLVGSTASDEICRDGIIALPNGNYLVRSSKWHNGTVADAGMIAWGNGNTGVSGVVGPSNSLVGSSRFDAVGLLNNNLTILPNSNYIVSIPDWDKTPLYSVGAKTWGNGGTGVKGVVTDCNSVTGDDEYSGGALVHTFNNVNEYLLVGKPYENKVTVFYPDGMAMANNADEATEFITGNTAVPFIVNPGCRIIASVTPTGGATKVSGNVTAKLWIESSVQTYLSRPYVARHQEITPHDNASTATGLVTLYFTQQEFIDFNNHSGSTLNLPTIENDAAGKANLRIVKLNGTSNNGTGLPESYTNGASLINPDDADITWNNFHSRWEVNINVTGFSGFIVVTDQAILPLKLLEFTAMKKADDVLLHWKTTGEFNTDQFEVERSLNGTDFFKIGAIPAINLPAVTTYAYTDVLAAKTYANNGKLYYRLKSVEIDKRSSYSMIVPVYLNTDLPELTLYLHPVPFNNFITYSLKAEEPGMVRIQLADMYGRIVYNRQYMASRGISTHSISDLGNLPAGVYLFNAQLKGAVINQTIIKQ